MNEWFDLECQHASISINLHPDAPLGFDDCHMQTPGVFTLPCVETTNDGYSLRFDGAGWADLEDFLDHFEFVEKEAFGFVYGLLKQASHLVSAWPAVLHPKGIGVDPCGQRFCWILLPISLEGWMERTRDIRQLLEFLLKKMNIPCGFSLQGFLYAKTQEERLNLPHLIQEFEEFYKHLFGRRGWLFRKELPCFHNDRPFVETRGNLEMTLAPAEFAEHSLGSKMDFAAAGNEKVWIDSSENRIDQTATEIQEQTQLLNSDEPELAGTLEIEGKRYELQYEHILIGRSLSCDICLKDPTVSSAHAKITVENGRCYIQDLKSANGTWIDQHQVIRRMRLKEGMKIRFGQATGIFHE